MLTESFVAATLSANKPNAHLSSALKDVGVFLYEFQPQSTFRQGFKKSSVHPQGVAISSGHVFAAQADKAVINVYGRVKGNLEATIPFPDKIRSIVYAEKASTLIIGTDDGKLILWEVATGRISTSSAAHLEPVSHLDISQNNDIIVSGSADANLHVWSLSALLAFPHSTSTADEPNGSKTPLRTFSKHRSAVSALTIGHSTTTTNFAVSSSIDQTCYIWHLESSQVLRTLLLPAITLCATVDPADRAVYFGCENGTIQHIDLFGHPTRTSKTSVFEADQAPIQLTTADSWKPTSELGPAQSITLSYDGTSLLSGHQGGKIIRWDVAKHRTISEIANLNQPVSCVMMLAPEGLRHNTSQLMIPNVVKPRLDLGTQADDGSLGIPPSYSIQAQVTRKECEPSAFDQDIHSAITQPGLPHSLLDDALRALLIGTASEQRTNMPTQGDVGSDVRIARLTEENESLKARMADMLRVEEETRARHQNRAKRREELIKKKAESYSSARRDGKDGDIAMKPFEAEEASINVESDEEYLTSSRMVIDT